MRNPIKIPTYKVVVYRNNLPTGYFAKTEQQPEITPVMRLPYELKVEPTQLHQIKCNASKIIRGKETFKNGSFKFFTGLQGYVVFGTKSKNWSTGNHYENLKGVKQRSLCLFHFCNDNSLLTVVYCSRFYIDNAIVRGNFINDFIPILEQHLQLLKIEGKD